MTMFSWGATDHSTLSGAVLFSIFEENQEITLYEFVFRTDQKAATAAATRRVPRTRPMTSQPRLPGNDVIRRLGKRDVTTAVLRADA